jgi:hypothetical protein
MARLVVVVPLKEGAREEARRLLDGGPPFDLEGSRFDHHQVHLTEREAVFVFESPEGTPATLSVRASDPTMWKAAAAWKPLVDGKPRMAETVFVWDRPAEG